MKNLLLLSVSLFLFLGCDFLTQKNDRRFILMIHTKEVLQELAGQNSLDPVFIEAISIADSFQRLKPKKKYSDLFFQVLASKNSSADKIFNGTTRSAVEEYLEQLKVRTRGVLQRRLEPDQKNAVVEIIPGTDLIKVEVHADENGYYDKITRLITSSGKMDFMYVRDPSEIYPQMIKINDYLVKKFPQISVEEDLSTDESAQDTVVASVSPLFSLLKGETLLYLYRDKRSIDELINLPEVKAFFPATKFIWTLPTPKDSLVELIPVKIPSSPGELLSGEHITKAEALVTDQEGVFEISFSLDEAGKIKWRNMTRFASQSDPKKRIAIVLDEICLMAPIVQGEIPGGKSSISGNFSFEEAKGIATVMKSGSCPATLRIIEEQEIKQ